MYCRSLLKCIVILGDLAQFWQYISLTVLLKAHKKVTIQSDNTNCYLWHSKFHKWQPKFKVVGCQCMVGVMSHSRRGKIYYTPFCAPSSKQQLKLWFILRRKPIFSGYYSHYESFMPSSYKVGLIYTLLHRAFTLCSTWEKFHEEVCFSWDRRSWRMLILVTL